MNVDKKADEEYVESLVKAMIFDHNIPEDDEFEFGGHKIRIRLLTSWEAETVSRSVGGDDLLTRELSNMRTTLSRAIMSVDGRETNHAIMEAVIKKLPATVLEIWWNHYLTLRSGQAISLGRLDQIVGKSQANQDQEESGE